MKVKVTLRIRPFSDQENEQECRKCLTKTANQEQIKIGKEKLYTFDKVYSESSTQNQLYEQEVQPLVKMLFQGYNATVLAYGQTGSGKTYTMGLNNEIYSNVIAISQNTKEICSSSSSDSIMNSSELNSNNFENVGIIPRVLEDIFKSIEEKQKKNKDANLHG